MVKNYQNVQVTQQAKKSKYQIVKTLEDYWTLEDYCLSNSLPKPVFQTKCVSSKNHEVIAKVGSYEAKGSGRLSNAKIDAANNLLTKLRGLETEIQIGRFFLAFKINEYTYYVFSSFLFVQSNLVIRNGLIRNKLVLRNHFP